MKIFLSKKYLCKTIVERQMPENIVTKNEHIKTQI